MSSESIQNSHSPRACRSDSLRAAEKSSHQGKWNSRPPNDSTIRGVSSTEPVSTITISSTQGRMLSRQAGSVRAESRTIMQSESRGRSPGAAAAAGRLGASRGIARLDPRAVPAWPIAGGRAGCSAGAAHRQPVEWVAPTLPRLPAAELRRPLARPLLPEPLLVLAA